MNTILTLGDISRGVVEIPLRSKSSTGVCYNPMAEAAGVRALLEPRCVGTEGTEYRNVGFKSSDGYVLIVYAFMYALLNGYLLCT